MNTLPPESSEDRGGAVLARILGMPPQQARPQDVLRLSRRRVMQLFFAAPCPACDELAGEYQGQNHPAGIISIPAGFFLDHFFGPGKWVGKAFRAAGATSGCGYNLFAQTGPDGRVNTRRARKIATAIGSSVFDGGRSFLLDYGVHNRGAFSFVRDELRKVNSELFIGLGYLAIFGGTGFASPFVIFGKPKDWVGCE